MGLIINHNLMAMNAARSLGRHYGALATSTQRLSSGLRINTAADDAAGLAIRELMRADISTLNQGIRNANDAISMVQTADGALQVVDEKLIRMKELAEQAASGTYSSTQRLIIDSEYQAMASEITRIANSTEFNGIYLLNGNLSGSAANGAGQNPTGKLKVHFGVGNSSAADYYYVQIGCCTASSFGLGLGASGGEVAKFVAEKNLYRSHYPPQTFSNFFSNGAYTAPQSVESQFDGNATPTAYYPVNNPGVDVYLIGQDKEGNFHALFYSGYSYVSDTVLSANAPAGASISTQALAQAALEKITSAIVSKDKIRANLGAMQNRLQNTITNLQIQAENLQASESQISDTDVAAEMTEFVREQILTQAATAMLAQANSLPKMALSLIQGG